MNSFWFAFPLQFCTALEWAGLFMCHYSCAASTAVKEQWPCLLLDLQPEKKVRPLLQKHLQNVTTEGSLDPHVQIVCVVFLFVCFFLFIYNHLFT